MNPYRSYMAKAAKEHDKAEELKQVAIDVGTGIIASRGMGGASLVGSSLVNAADYAAARYLADKALDKVIREPQERASL